MPKFCGSEFMPPQPVAHSSIPHPLLQLLEEVQDVDEGRDVSLRGSQKPEHKEPLVVLRDVEDPPVLVRPVVRLGIDESSASTTRLRPVILKPPIIVRTQASQVSITGTACEVGPSLTVFLLHQCVRVFDHDRPRLRPRELRAIQDEPIRVYVVVVHQP